jgi:coenzyme F420-reducing hydrogenase beta subunit
MKHVSSVVDKVMKMILQTMLKRNGYDCEVIDFDPYYVKVKTKEGKEQIIKVEDLQSTKTH